jgi:hypothetical protein
VQKSGENLIQAFGHREVVIREMLWNSNRLQDRQEHLDQKFDGNIVTDVAGVAPASEKFDERLFDNRTSSRDQIFGQGGLFAAQVADEDRLRFAGVPLEMRGESMKSIDEVAGIFLENAS